MGYIEGTVEVLAEGHNDMGQRMRIAASTVDYSRDLMPESDGYVPTMYMGYSWRTFSLTAVLNPYYFPVSSRDIMNAIKKIRCRFRDNWEKMSERWLRIMGAKDARVRVVELDQSNWGIMVTAFGQKWQDMTGVADDYTITREDTEEFENWLKGEVSRVKVQAASHDCNCEFCDVEWIDVDSVNAMTVYADTWDIKNGISDKYAYVVDEMIAESGMVQ